MEVIEIEKSSTDLKKLLQQVKDGGEILITDHQIPVAKLIGMNTPPKKAKFGSAKNLITIADDFDAPIEDFSDCQ